jgi:dephospho-CoA kinase
MMPGRSAPLVIGLTGPIGCGKSAVAGMLADIGATVIDADVLARRATAPGAPALEAIREHFGDGVVDAAGQLDRSALGRIVFDDPSALADLERIVHPHVRRLVDGALAAAVEAAEPIVAIEAIKLVEGGLAARCAEVWIVECSSPTQRARLAARGMPAADAEQRLAAQGPDLVTRLVERLADRPHRRISTEGSLEETRRRVAEALADALAR